MLKVIFLDIDGVLNTSKTFEEIYFELKKSGQRRVEIDLIRVRYLKEIVDRAKAIIVLSSSLRLHFTKKDDMVVPKDEKAKKIMKIFNDYGLSIYDLTLQDINGVRQEEILAWLYGKDIYSYVVIDDDESDLSMFIDNGRLIKTNFYNFSNSFEDAGLCEHHIEEAIQILNKKSKTLIK